jgi:spermidine synthase
MHHKPGKAPAIASNAGASPAQRNYLYFTAAVTGMVIMIVEILGAKMLAPYVGTSHFVWTAQITVTLVALATGYYAGGRLADRAQQLGRLYAAILVAAVYLCLTVLIIKPVANWCLDFRLAFGSLLASAILFFIPLALLAMVGPFFVRVLTQSVSHVGGHVGRLASVSTIGSVIGTLLIGYVLIPFLPNSTIMLMSAGLLMLVATGYFVRWRTKKTSIASIVLLIITALAISVAAVAYGKTHTWPGTTLMYNGNSNFGQLLVLDIGPQRCYLNDLLVQDRYDVAAKKSPAAFTYLLHGLARGYNPHIQKVLCIGLGVGIVPAEFQREGAAVDVVEINPAVVPLAKNLFDCPIEKLNLTIGDGRQFVNRSLKNKYDAVILDAFLGESSPSHLMTREAFEAIRNVLKPEGVLVINTFGRLEPGRDFLPASLHKTLKSVFGSVRLHTVGMGAIFFAASPKGELRPFDYPNPESIHSECRAEVLNVIGDLREPDPQSGIVLTDDYNPAEFYDALNREELRRRLAAHQRDMEMSATLKFGR